jgi:hypothetical protein
VETGAECGAEPDVQQAAQEEDEAAAEARGATSQRSRLDDDVFYLFFQKQK